MSDLDLNIELRITEKRTESRDCLSLFFERPQGFTYGPGDWMDIRFPTPEFPVGRTYSFASSPTEPDLRITFKTGMTPFKRHLEDAMPGDTMLITQYGSNGFVLNRRFAAVLVAGGVGITPFRSMLKELVDTNSSLPVTLIYQNRGSDFPFKAELDEWSRQCSALTTHYVATETEGRLNKRALQPLLPGLGDGTVMSYIAGPPGMVDRTEGCLRALGADQDRIMLDRFDGY